MRLGRNSETVILLTVSFLLLVKSEDIYCPDIAPIKNGDTKISSDPPYRVNTTIKFTCDRGFKGKGPINIICLPNGKWSENAPVCQASFDCIRDISKTEKGRRCRKACKTDDDCKGGFKRCRCDDSCGKSCFNPEATCKQPPEPENGYLLFNSLQYGHSVTYNCNKGYVLSGRERRTCRSDRKWSGTPPECIALSTCGQAGGQELVNIGRVVGGTNADIGEWPWQALLFRNKEYKFNQIYDKTSTIAGGSIINEKWILSAAHVFDEFPSIFIALGMTVFPEENSVLKEYIQIYEPDYRILHPDYDSDTFDFDVALVRIGNRLKRSGDKFVVDASFPSGVITYNLHIRPVCLPCLKHAEYDDDIWGRFEKLCGLDEAKLKKTYAKPNTHAYVTGFGKTYVTDNMKRALPGRVIEGLLKILDDLKCAKAVQTLAKDNLPLARYTNRMICAKSANKSLKTDSCQGDSGGPLVEKIEVKGKSYWVQVGIVSWGWGCGNEFPGFYASITSVMGWIVLHAESCKLPEMNKDVVVREENQNLKDRHKTDFKLGSRISLGCAKGKSLIGKKSAVCGKLGWDSPMNQTCVKETLCEEIAAPDFGSLKFQSTAQYAPYPSGTEVTLTCNKNYNIAGEGSSTCGMDGKWSNVLGKCEKDDPGCAIKLDKIPDNNSVFNAFFSMLPGDTQFNPGDFIIIQCSRSFAMTGTSCNKDRKWEPALEDIFC